MRNIGGRTPSAVTDSPGADEIARAFGGFRTLKGESGPDRRLKPGVLSRKVTPAAVAILYVQQELAPGLEL